MFVHNLKYSFKTLFRNKMLIFWTFIFPIILGTFFNLAFSDIESGEKLSIIDIAIVNNDEFQNNEMFKESFKILSDEENEERLFNTRYTTEEEAKRLLENDEIVGYMILNDNKPKIIFATNGVNETIFKYVTEQISQSSEMINKLASEEIMEETILNNSVDYEKIYINTAKRVMSQSANIEDKSNKNLSYTMIEYYTLIAMTCLYGAILSVFAINQNLPNMSSKGKRVSIAPTSKGKVIFSSLLASYLTQLIGLAILFIYTIFVLKVNYGSNVLLVILLAAVGSLAGLSLGLLVGTILKANDNIKTGVIIAVSMLGCFLSGMMGITMKYIVDKNIPIINKLNPASMITDGFYALYYYDTLDRYFFNIVSLLIFSGVLVAISYFSLRRQKYDSI